jgi:hypothetical protein
MKKYLLGMIAVVLAAGFSAFTSTPSTAKFTQYTFFRNSGTATSVDPADYIYRPSGGCNSNPNSNCSARWDQSTAPLTNDHPAFDATFVSGSVTTGNYNGN